MASSIIGIDLGTTNSAVAVMKPDGSTYIIPNRQGTTTTPSYVAFAKDQKAPLVGQPAKSQQVTNPENTLYETKRIIGKQSTDSTIKKLHIGYKIVKGPNGDAWVEVTDQDKAKKLSPEQVASYVLTELKKVAEKYLGHDVTGAVITVPAYFNDVQRQATKDAGKIAGLEVKRIINEPTAAALAYGMDKQKSDRKIAVYDLGGGTFDVSIIEIANVDGDHQFEVLSTSGDTALGGADFDEKLLHYLVDEFKKDNSIDLLSDKVATQRLKEAAEKAKIALSTQEQTDVNLPFITADQNGPKHLNVKITRAKFESMVDDLIKGTLAPCKTALKDADLSASDIHDVILVGGQTRMPKVQEAVKNFFNKEPRHDVNPDEAVARGAAIQGGVLSGSVKDILLLDVTPLSLGIETLGDVMAKLIEKNTTIPTKATQTFSTAADNQPEVTVHVVQGERSRASTNKSLGRFNLSDIPPAPRGVPQIEVTFDIDANGILHVSAKDKVTNKSQSIAIQDSSGLSKEDIEKMVEDAKEHADADEAFQKLSETRNTAEALIHSSKKAMTDLGDKVTDEEKTSVESAISELEGVMKEEDLSAIEEKLEALKKAANTITEKLYAEQAQADAPDAEKTGADDNADSKDKDDGKTVDAEFEEVKDEEQDKK